MHLLSSHFAFFAFTVAINEAASKPVFFQEYDSEHFKVTILNFGGLSWTSADFYCRNAFDFPSHLATINNEDENEEWMAIRDSIAPDAACWMGLNNIYATQNDTDNWYWVDGNILNTGYFNWASYNLSSSNEPTHDYQHCVMGRDATSDPANSGKWRDANCSETARCIVCNKYDTSTPTALPTVSPIEVFLSFNDTLEPNATKIMTSDAFLKSMPPSVVSTNASTSTTTRSRTRTTSTGKKTDVTESVINEQESDRVVSGSEDWEQWIVILVLSVIVLGFIVGNVYFIYSYMKRVDTDKNGVVVRPTTQNRKTHLSQAENSSQTFSTERRMLHANNTGYTHIQSLPHLVLPIAEPMKSDGAENVKNIDSNSVNTRSRTSTSGKEGQVSQRESAESVDEGNAKRIANHLKMVGLKLPAPPPQVRTSQTEQHGEGQPPTA